MVSLRSILTTSGLQAETEKIKSVRVVAQALVEGQQAKAELKRMASLASVSDRIKAKKALYAKNAEAWGARLDRLDKLEPDAFAATEAAIAAHETDLAGMEADMRALTNGDPTS
jgi:hypothetical protein